MPDGPVPLIIIRHDQWETFAERVTEAGYEAIDNEFEHLHIPIDVVAGMFFTSGNPAMGLERAIYADADLAVPALLQKDTRKGIIGEGLAKHEKGHEEGVALNDHPTGILPRTIRDKDGKVVRREESMLTHAWKVGFDYRAATRILRFRKGPAPAGFASWWGNQQRLYATGQNPIRPAPAAP